MVCVLKSSGQCRRESLSGGVKHRGRMFNKGVVFIPKRLVNVRNLILSKLGYSWGVLVLLNFCKILVSSRFCGVCAR